MLLITHQNHINQLPESTLKDHIQKRFDQLFETEFDLLPNIVLIEEGDDITGPDFSWAGNRGILSDIMEVNEIRQPGFSRVLEWASYIPSAQIFEALVLLNNEDGILVLIPEGIVSENQDLYWLLTDESQGGLSDPQPQY